MDDRRKRLIFRAWRRGFREMDLILGSYADTHAENLEDADLIAFEGLLDSPDQDVYDWLLARAAPPARHDTPLLGRIRAHMAAGVVS